MRDVRWFHEGPRTPQIAVEATVHGRWMYAIELRGLGTPMRWTVVAANRRIDKLSFEADEDWQIYPRSTYACPNCGERVTFNLHDLGQHAFSEFTNLCPNDAEMAEEAAEGAVVESNSFLDFYCPNCRTPARIYYEAWAGGRFTWGYEVRFVVEPQQGGP